MPPLGFGGHDFRVAGQRALFWPHRRALILADLHLEKASWFARRGQMLPPHDSLATLDAIAGLIGLTGAAELWCLGDNFHDCDGPARMESGARERLAALTGSIDWHWITGNHDEHLPDGIGGTIHDQAGIDGVILRHRAEPGEHRPELSGHFHPKYRATGPRGGVSRACFVVSETRMILPAFGAFTGGLDAYHPEIMHTIGGHAEALIATGKRLLRFPLTRERGERRLVSG